MSEITYTVTIESLSHEGRGIAHLPDGKCCFIPMGLPGELLEITLTENKRNFAVGKIIQRFSAHPARVEPSCPHFGVCGGCQLQHISPEFQIKMKEKQLLEQLKHFGKIEIEQLEQPLLGQAFGYRRKARIGLRYVQKKSKLLMGFRENQSRYLADLSTCKVLRQEFSEHFEDLRLMLESFENRQDLAQIEIAVGDEETAIILRNLSPIADADLKKLIAWGEATKWHIYLQPKGMDSVHRIFPSLENAAEVLSYTLKKRELIFDFHPTDFVQVNASINEQMVERAIDWLDLQTTDRVLDLFCGLGNFSLPLAQCAKEVVAIEGSELMTKRLASNALKNNLHNIQAFSCDLAKVPFEGNWVNAQYDKLLIDPPRAGAEAILQYINLWNPTKIVYVSCNPATFARDVGLLKALGYNLKKVCVMDMFTHTEHTETMGLLERC